MKLFAATNCKYEPKSLKLISIREECLVRIPELQMISLKKRKNMKKKEKVELHKRLLISREEALQRLVERIGPMNIIPKLGLDDLKGLMVQITRYAHVNILAALIL